MKKTGTIFLLCLAVCALRAQTPPQLMATVDRSAIVLTAPPPFVEVSAILPEAFAQRSQAVAATNRLLAWFMPLADLKEQLAVADKTSRCRILQIQVMKDMEEPRYDSATFQAMRADMLAGMPRIAEEDAGTLFAVLNLAQLGQKAGAKKILGVAELGTDSFTICIAVSTEGRDQHGGRDVETSLTCVTYLLVGQKILLLSVTAPDVSARELRNSIRLSREWLDLLRWKNAIPKTQNR
jgi:hypothetical protein